MGVRAVIAAWGLGTHIFVMVQGSVATSSPHGSSVEPMHDDNQACTLLLRNDDHTHPEPLCEDDSHTVGRHYGMDKEG